jgi:N-acetylmuramoyl-L-alanine amidase
MKILLDAGHGANTPGKRSPDGIQEFEFNSAVAALTKDILKDYECTVEYAHDPTGKVDVPLEKRVDFANRAGFEVYVSIHANAFGNDWNEANGIETYVHTNKPKSALELAQKIQDNLIKATGRKNRGVKTAEFYVLNKTKMDAILIECGFMTNKEEASLLKSSQYRLKCAESIVKGVVEHYKLKPKVKPVKPVAKKTIYLKTGSFPDKESAEKMAADIRKSYGIIVHVMVE